MKGACVVCVCVGGGGGGEVVLDKKLNKKRKVWRKKGKMRRPTLLEMDR